MATIEEAIRLMLTSNISTGVADDQITHAYRLQNSPLPAITFELSQTKRATIDGLQTSELVITGIADQTKDANDLGSVIRAALVTGTYSGIIIRQIIVGDTTLQPPSSGLSDEQEPALLNINATIYWN
jgi:hypothetical protein